MLSAASASRIHRVKPAFLGVCTAVVSDDELNHFVFLDFKRGGKFAEHPMIRLVEKAGVHRRRQALLSFLFRDSFAHGFEHANGGCAIALAKPALKMLLHRFRVGIVEIIGCNEVDALDERRGFGAVYDRCRRSPSWSTGT